MIVFVAARAGAPTELIGRMVDRRVVTSGIGVVAERSPSTCPRPRLLSGYEQGDEPVTRVRRRRDRDRGPVVRALAIVVAAVAAAGCAGTRQGNAEQALEARLGESAVSCTRAARRGYLHELDTKVFLCLARRGTGDCDRYRVTRGAGRYRVRLLERHADCVLPPS